MNNPDQTDKIKRLQRLIDRGEYQVDSRKVARKIVICLFPELFVAHMKKRRQSFH